MRTSITFIFFIFLGLILLVNNSFSLPWSTDLWDHPSIKPYEEARDYPKDSVFRNEESMELERKEYEAIITGPNRGDLSIVKGKELYEVNCYSCHGMTGLGDGPVIKNDLRQNSYFYPVSLKQQQTINRTDGYIYAYIRYGGKVMMPAYGRITPEEAWDIVYYLRYLQGKVK
ncbi:MAG: c-type cytochrome [Thermodesulfobacteriota bacterium]|nr:MAG: cytochrome c [Candidatus Dadabacteria bacterium]